MIGFDRLVRRRAKPGVPSQDVRRAAVWAKTGGYCYLCGANLRGTLWHVDHMWSVSRMGPDVLANMMPACATCNEAKGSDCILPFEGTIYRARKATIHLALWLHAAAKCGPEEYVIPVQPILGPHVATLRLKPPPGYLKRMGAMREEICASLNQKDAAVRLVGSELWVSVPRKVWRDVRLVDMNAGQDWMDLGLSEMNAAVPWNWTTAPHMLVAGRTGSGKSEIARTVVAQAIRMGAKLALVDADGTTFDPFERSASLLCAVANDLPEAGRVIRYVHAVMEERRPDPDQQPPILLAVDELHVLSTSDRTILADMGQRMRRRNMHLALFTHRPVAEVILPVLKDQCPVRVALSVGDSLASRLIIDMPGAERLRGRGDALIVGASGPDPVVRFRAAIGDDALWARLPKNGLPPAAPDVGIPEAVDVRYVRKPNDEMVEFLVQRYRAEGLVPSTPPLAAKWGGNSTRLRAARDEACRLLGIPTPQERRSTSKPVSRSSTEAVAV